MVTSLAYQEHMAAATNMLALQARGRESIHMLKGVPHFDGTDKSKYWDWADVLERLSREMNRNPREVAMIKSGPEVQRTIASFDKNENWSVIRKELERCYSNVPTTSHAVARLRSMRQRSDEDFRSYCARYSKFHAMATGLAARDQKDMTHIVLFLSSINNTSIGDKLIKAKHQPANLRKAFEEAIKLEEEAQASEGLRFNRTNEVAEIRHQQPRGRRPRASPTREDDYYAQPSGGEEEVNEISPEMRDRRARGLKCYGCGEPGHFKRACPYLPRYDPRKRRDEEEPQEWVHEVGERPIGRIHQSFDMTAPVDPSSEGTILKCLGKLVEQMTEKGKQKNRSRSPSPSPPSKPRDRNVKVNTSDTRQRVYVTSRPSPSRPSRSPPPSRSFPKTSKAKTSTGTRVRFSSPVTTTSSNRSGRPISSPRTSTKPAIKGSVSEVVVRNLSTGEEKVLEGEVVEVSDQETDGDQAHREEGSDRENSSDQE